MSSSDAVLAQSGFDALRVGRSAQIIVGHIPHQWFFKWSLQTNRAYNDTLQAFHVSTSTRYTRG
ncbi:unnamed protein product [Brassica oleracea var. botrytis]